jgi:hypothetical protein
MMALFAFQCDWLGPIVVIVDETDMAQDDPAPRGEREPKRPGISARFRSAIRKMTGG